MGWETLYREGHLLADFIWVDFEFGSSTFCLVLLRLMGSWQNWLCGCARWWNIPNPSQLNPVCQEMDLPVDIQAVYVLYKNTFGDIFWAIFMVNWIAIATLRLQLQGEVAVGERKAKRGGIKYRGMMSTAAGIAKEEVCCETVRVVT